MKQQATFPAGIPLGDCLQMPVIWTRNADHPTRLWRAEVGPDRWALRVNDFPAEHLYTLFVNDREAGSFEEWPNQWVRA